MAQAKTKPAAAKPAKPSKPKAAAQAVPPVEIPAAEIAADAAAVELPLHLIDENPDNPREGIDEEADAELTSSIGARGVLQPIMVRPDRANPGRYVVVMGSRRRRCSLAAGKLTIPAVIRDGLDDDQAFELATIENVARNNMSAMDDARAYRRMIDRRLAKDPTLTLKAAKEAVARVVGKSVRIIELRLEFLDKLPPIKQVELAEGKISAKEATDWIRKQPKPLDLTADEWLLALEVFDKVQAAPVDPNHYSAKYMTECHADARFDERVKRLCAYPFELFMRVDHMLDENSDVTGRFRVGSGYGVASKLELKFGPLKTASQRLHAMDGLRQQLGLPRLEPGYSTPWLNGPFECPDSIKGEIAEARRIRAEERAQRAAEQAEREQAEAEQRAKAEAEKEAGKAFLADVMALQADLEAAAAVGAKGGDPDLTEDAFRNRFRELWAKRGVKGPFIIAPGEDPHRDPTQLVDGAGEPNADRGAGLEGRRRLMALALNFAGGWPMTSGPLFQTPWSPDAPAPTKPTEILPREEFARLVADYLADDCEDLPDDPAEAQFELTERTSRGLDAFLAQEGIEYGDPAYDWSDDGAMALAEGIRVDGLGQDAPPAADEPAAPAEAGADDVELSPALQRLAGVKAPAAQVEAQP